MDTQLVPYQHWCALGLGATVCQFSFSYPFFKPLKMPFKFTFSPPLIKINSCHIYYVGGAVGSWLVRPTPERVVRVWGLAADIVLCYWARHFTLTVPVFTQVYKWLPTDLMLGVTLRWTGIPSRAGGRNNPSRFMLQKPG